MKKIFKTVFTLTLLTILILPGTARAWRNMIPPAPVIMKVADKIGLNDTQLEKIKELTYNTKETLITIKADLAKAQLKLHKILDNNKSTESQIANAVDEVSKHKNIIHKKKVIMMFKIKNILTKEQLTKLREAAPFGRGGMGKHGKGMKKGMGHGKGKGMGHGMGHEDGMYFRDDALIDF